MAINDSFAELMGVGTVTAAIVVGGVSAAVHAVVALLRRRHRRVLIAAAFPARPPRRPGNPARILAPVDLADEPTVADVVDLPWDTDNPNSERALMALGALYAHAQDAGNLHADSVVTVMGDLLCNLRHLCDALGVDFDQVNDQDCCYGEELYDRDMLPR